jgi:hypothetical protein
MMRLRQAAVANVTVHLVGLACALLMRPGTALFSLEARMRFLGEAPIGWEIGWGVWMLCALALGGFFVLLAESLPPATRRAALTCVGAAIAVDLFCDAAQMAVLPLAARGDPGLFVIVERLAGIGGTLVANGLYTLATVLAAWSLRRPLLAVAVGVAGAAMCIGGVLDAPRIIELSTGPTIVLFCLFTVRAAWA